MQIINTVSPTKSYGEFKREYYGELHARAKAAMRRKAEGGDLPGCAPVGYANKRDGEKTYIVVDEQMAPLVKDAFRLAARGTLSLRTILQRMTGQGLRSRNGKAMGVSALRNMLMNPFYTGCTNYQGEILHGNHFPVIEAALFQQVQKRLKQRRRRLQE